jgi:hypothetical protein
VQTGSSSALVEIVSITGSHGGDQYANGMVSLTNGSGITKTDPADPSTWTFNGSNYPDEWMATYLKVGGTVTPGLNGKVAWACLDFGSKTALGMLYLFNTNYSSGVSGTDQFNLYYATSPSVALPAQPAKGTYSPPPASPRRATTISPAAAGPCSTPPDPLNASQGGITSLNLPGVSARYLAIEILSNQGDSYGGGRVGFDEIAVTAAPPDSDGDGLPDAYELANTDPPSATALNPGDDLEPDGLTNLQEYVLGTDPNCLPTPTATASMTAPKTPAPAAARRPTRCLPTPTATASTISWKPTPASGSVPPIPAPIPTKADTDGDGLKDKRGNQHRHLCQRHQHRHQPPQPDSDGDGAGDWYEVAIIDKNPALGSPPNSPNDSGLKPNIPYPLPDPDHPPAPLTSRSRFTSCPASRTWSASARSPAPAPAPCRR